MHSSPLATLLDRLGRGNEPVRIAHSDNTDFRVSLIAHTGLAQAIEALNEERRNVWFEVNPSHYAEEFGRSSAGHVRRLAALWADLDFKDGGMGSEPACWAVIDDLSAALGVQPAIVVHSGGGLQPYWPILDGVIEEESRDTIATQLKRWGMLVAQVCANNGGQADNVFDLARILRVPGTLNVKRQQVPVEAKIVAENDVPDIELAWLAEVLNDYEIGHVDAEVGVDLISPAHEWEWAESNCSFVDTALNEILSSNPASRHHWALKWSALIHGMIRSGCVTEEGYEKLKLAMVSRFKRLLESESNPRPYRAREIEGILKDGLRRAQQWSKSKLGTEMRGHTHADFFEVFESPKPAPVPLEPQAEKIEQNMPQPKPSNVSSIFTRQPVTQGSLAVDSSISAQQRLSAALYTDTGNAERLAQWLAGRFIWVPEIGWEEWQGSRWQGDKGNRVLEAAKDMFVQMAALGDDAQREWAQKSLSKARLTASLELAKSVSHITVAPGELDARPYEINTPGGIVNLKTAELRKANPLEDYHTMQTSWAPDDREIPRFLEFLHWAMQEEPGTPEAQSRVMYLQRIFGLATIGTLLQHVLPIFLGVGANGKSTLLDIVLMVLGSYGTVLPGKFLVDKRQEPHPTEIARLRGVRLASASEVPPTAAFDEELVKRITGEPNLTARYVNKDFFTFPNTVTMCLAANHLPSVRVGGPSFWRRARKIDFGNIMPLPKQNPNLAREIAAEEGPGILRWMIEGAVRVQKIGLQDPPSVLVATRQYQLEEDVIARFIDANLVQQDGVAVDREAAYQSYKQWVYREGGNPLSMVKFAREITTILPRTNLGSRKEFTHVRLSYVPNFDEGFPE